MTGTTIAIASLRRMLARAAMGVTLVVAATAAAAESDWRVDVNGTVAKGQSWTWILQSVERSSDTLTLNLAYRNGSFDGRPLFLEEGFMEKIALTAGSESFPLVEVEGISEQLTRVGRNRGRTARFTFRYPEGAEEVVFDSNWITLMMGGTAQVVRVEFPVPRPPGQESF